MSAAIDARLSKLLEAHKSLEEQLAKAAPGSVDPLLNLKARWSCEALRDRLALVEARWIQTRRSA